MKVPRSDRRLIDGAITCLGIDGADAMADAVRRLLGAYEALAPMRPVIPVEVEAGGYRWLVAQMKRLAAEGDISGVLDLATKVTRPDFSLTDTIGFGS